MKWSRWESNPRPREFMYVIYKLSYKISLTQEWPCNGYQWASELKFNLFTNSQNEQAIPNCISPLPATREIPKQRRDHLMDQLSSHSVSWASFCNVSVCSYNMESFYECFQLGLPNTQSASPVETMTAPIENYTRLYGLWHYHKLWNWSNCFDLRNDCRGLNNIWEPTLKNEP